mgnify:CR=1 FL=1
MLYCVNDMHWSYFVTFFLFCHRGKAIVYRCCLHIVLQTVFNSCRPNCYILASLLDVCIHLSPCIICFQYYYENTLISHVTLLLNSGKKCKNINYCTRSKRGANFDRRLIEVTKTHDPILNPVILPDSCCRLKQSSQSHYAKYCRIIGTLSAWTWSLQSLIHRE